MVFYSDILSHHRHFHDNANRNIPKETFWFLFCRRLILPLGQVLHCEITWKKLTCRWCRGFSDQDFQHISVFYIILHIWKCQQNTRQGRVRSATRYVRLPLWNFSGREQQHNCP